MHVRFISLVALSCLFLLCAPPVAAPAERTAIYPGTPGPEINSHILFETVFQLNDLLPSRWTAAQRKEVAYILERMGMEIPKTIAERLRESGFIYVLQD